VILESKILQAVLIFVSACYFIGEGISIDTWLIIGILAWILMVHLMLGMVLSDSAPSMQRNLLAAVAVILLLIGSAQLSYLALYWASSSAYFHTVCALLLFVITGLLWWRNMPELMKSFSQNSNPDLF